MKSIAVALALAVTLVAASLIYPDTMRVTEVNDETNTVTMETSTGMVFEMYGVEDWRVNDIASVLMFSYGTEKVYDDAILMAYNSGFTYTELRES